MIVRIDEVITDKWIMKSGFAVNIPSDYVSITAYLCETVCFAVIAFAG